ncbi:phosphate signaling complex protein PhoU [Zavarzinia sp. CC-PAN008]|uniref:phosphate signaling complex protein PhoU n=1 Tax=Zavarzinia sp. CC-PAN008 TaxID=3243332 RepID=UPI003F749459
MAELQRHIVKSFDEELKQLNSRLLRMGGVAEAQLAAAIQAVAKRDVALADRTIAADAQVDTFQQEIDEQVTRLLALRQPMAIDLRAVIGALRLAGDIERIADYASNIAKRSKVLAQSAPMRPTNAVPRMGGLAQGMIKDVLDAAGTQDVEKAISVWMRDGELDELYNSFFRELLTYMMEDPRNITPCTHLLFIAKNIERIGDHATNMAEVIHYTVTGTRLTAERPKGDDTATFAGPDLDGGDDVDRVA